MSVRAVCELPRAELAFSPRLGMTNRSKRALLLSQRLRHFHWRLTQGASAWVFSRHHLTAVFAAIFRGALALGRAHTRSSRVSHYFVQAFQRLRIGLV